MEGGWRITEKDLPEKMTSKMKLSLSGLAGHAKIREESLFQEEERANVCLYMPGYFDRTADKLPWEMENTLDEPDILVGGLQIL